MSKMIYKDIKFSAEESTDGCCPVCQSDDLDYKASESVGDMIFYPWVCKSCGTVGKEYAKIKFDGHTVSYVPKNYAAALMPMKKIAVIQNGYVRDLQIFTEDPAIIEKDPDWEEKFDDHKYPCQFVGVFEGADENEIIRKAAESEGVHPGVITLIDIKKGAGDAA